MVKESRDYLELASLSIKVFDAKGGVDRQALHQLLDIALRDGKIDKNEIRVLSNLFSKLKAGELDSAIMDKIRELENTHQIELLPLLG